MSRKLATIRVIAEIRAIPDADLICAYRVDGWWVVDRVGAHQVGDTVIYAEPDSWIPHSLAPYLTRGDQEPRTYEGVSGQRLRTVRLKKQLSQGLLLPITPQFISDFNGIIGGDGAELPPLGHDCSDQLGIRLWEAPVPASLAGEVRGMFPTAVPKTEAVRIQNITGYWAHLREHEWEVTEKLHGSSCTMFLDSDGDFHVCSRNLDLKPTEGNSFWAMATKYDVYQRMSALGLGGLAIQSELVGTGINGNQYQLTLELFVFNMYDTITRTHLPAEQRLELCNKLGLKHAPVLGAIATDQMTVDQMLDVAQGTSCINGSAREGIVLKSQRDPSIMIKVISNQWLLKNH